MWVVFRRSDGAVVGSTAGTEDFDKEKAAQHVAGNLVGNPDPAELDAVEVKDEDQLFRLGESASRGLATVRTVGGSLTVVENTQEQARLVVTTDATEFHPVDNVPLLAADGSSFLVVTLQKVSQDEGKPMERTGDEKEQEEEIWLRASHGSVREDSDERPAAIRSVRLSNGVARFRFYSEPAKRLATVQMLSANPNLIIDGLQVELI